jgi:hypothetical protein
MFLVEQSLCDKFESNRNFDLTEGSPRRKTVTLHNFPLLVWFQKTVVGSGLSKMVRKTQRVWTALNADCWIADASGRSMRVLFLDGLPIQIDDAEAIARI